MEKIFGVLGGIPQSTSRNDDDIIDRISYRYTVAMFILFSIIVSTSQYVGDPINCWVPAHFSGAWEAYANSYCWIKNTYYLPFQEYIPAAQGDGEREMITYYQWVPLILLVQALLFYLPCVLWRTLNARSGIDLNNIVEASESFQNSAVAASKEKTMEYLVRQINRYVTSQKEYVTRFSFSIKTVISKVCCRMCGRRHGNYLVVLYLLIKVMYIANSLCQLFLLNSFLGTNYHFYGIEVIRSLIHGKDWTASNRFPRVTMCDFNVRRLGNIQRYTVQCVLPINLFNEKIYLFIWFWLVTITTLTCFNLLAWLLKIVIKSDRRRFIAKHLSLLNKLESVNDPEKIGDFVYNYLQQDGVFVLRLVSRNTDAITATELIAALWDNFLKNVSDADDYSDKKIYV